MSKYDKAPDRIVAYGDSSVQLRHRQKGIEFMVVYDTDAEWGDTLTNDEARELRDAIDFMLSERGA